MEKHQKILYVVEAMGGGIFTYMIALANGLCGQFDITIAYGRRDETPKNIEEYFDSRINLICVEQFERSASLSKNYLAIKQLRRIVREIKPDIIHLHSSIAGAVGRLFLRNKGARMFYTPHGYSFLMKDIAPVKRTCFKLVEKLCGFRNCVTIACGKGEWEQSKKVSRKAVYVWNGIDTDKIDAVLGEIQAEETPFTVYTVGRITYQKNPEKFNEIAGLLPDVRFCWIGDGEMRDVLKSPNIEITGWKESEGVFRLAGKGNIFLLTSRWEGLPMSLLEAMYMKKLCVVSDIAGNRDIIVDGSTGYLCDTPQQFAQKIKEIQNHDESAVAERAYEEVACHHTNKNMCGHYAELYLNGAPKDC